MQRYGFLLVEKDSEDVFKNIHVHLYNNIFGCVSTAGTSLKIAAGERLVYFKILKNSDIVRLLHEKGAGYTYGYCLLKRPSVNEPFKITDSSETFYTSMLDCLTSAKTICLNDDDECCDENKKIGYFKLLTDNEVVKYLHCK